MQKDTAHGQYIDIGEKWDNSYARLPGKFYTAFSPVPVSTPSLIIYNRELSTELGLSHKEFSSQELANIFSGNVIPVSAEPIALAYAGHQFGSFVPQLGDGRAVLLGEVRDAQGKNRDIQLKGSGRTPYSRGADGRSPLGPVIREYIVSEAMHALGIPTTRSLAAVLTGEDVIRDIIFPGAVLTRVASSHVRIGTFQYFAARRDQNAVKILADYVIARLYPEIAKADNPYLSLLNSVIDRQARLIASWMNIGFIHGVMNTDNMTISGETIDFGPCAFLDHYDPNQVFSSIDVFGRYAYSNQAGIGLWNLTRFAESLLPLIDSDINKAVDKAENAVQRFIGIYESSALSGMRAKLGLEHGEQDDEELFNTLLNLMEASKADYTLTFYALTHWETDKGKHLLQDIFKNSPSIKEWLERWKIRLAREPGVRAAELMRRSNPVYIPRNHRIEAVIRAAHEGDFSPMHKFIEVLSMPAQERGEFAEYALPPQPDQVIEQTFCGT